MNEDDLREALRDLVDAVENLLCNPNRPDFEEAEASLERAKVLLHIGTKATD